MKYEKTINDTIVTVLQLNSFKIVTQSVSVHYNEYYSFQN